jgi:hypothetical protein
MYASLSTALGSRKAEIMTCVRIFPSSIVVEQMTSLEGSSGEPLSQDFRRQVISKTVRDISEGRLVLRVDQKSRRPEDIELISGTVGKLIGQLNDLVSGTKAGEELEFLEKELFFCISVLRTYDVLKTNTEESRVEESLRKLEARTDSINLRLDEILDTLHRKEPAVKKPPINRPKGKRQPRSKKK